MDNELHGQPLLQPISPNRLLAFLIPGALMIGAMIVYWILEESLPTAWRIGSIGGIVFVLLVLAFALRAFYGKGALLSSYVFQSCLGLCLVFLSSTDYYREGATGGTGLLLIGYAIGLLMGAVMTYGTSRRSEETIARRKEIHVKAIYDYVQLWLAITLGGLFFALNLYRQSGTGLFPMFAAWQLSMGLFGMIWVYQYENRAGIRLA